MRHFHSYFLMNTEDVRHYVSDVLHFFEPGEETSCTEIGDGNINYVFRICSGRDGRSLIVKQADRLLRSSGRPLDQHRSRIEVEALRTEGTLAPGYVPEVYYYDEVMAAIAMEDISSFRNLRTELAQRHACCHLGKSISDFLLMTLLPTTDLVMDAEEKKRRVQFFTNPELCRITEDLVLTEPFHNYKGRNIITMGNEAFVQEHLYEDEQLHAEVAKLRLGFMSNTQALIHGDLHSGSIFVNDVGMKVLDPEFAFYGPMGYDIGNVLGNLFFPWAAEAFCRSGESDFTEYLAGTIEEVYDRTRFGLEERFDALVRSPLCRAGDFRQWWLDGVMADAAGYAGTEIIRRTVGDSKVSDLTSVSDLSCRVPMERALILLGVSLIMSRKEIRSGNEITDCFRRILA